MTKAPGDEAVRVQKIRSGFTTKIRRFYETLEDMSTFDLTS